MFRHINSFKSKHEQNPAYIMRQLLIALYYAKQKREHSSTDENRTSQKRTRSKVNIAILCTMFTSRTIIVLPFVTNRKHY